MFKIKTFFFFPQQNLDTASEILLNVHPLSEWTVERIPCFVFGKCTNGRVTDSSPLKVMV